MASQEIIDKVDEIELYAKEHGITYTKACAIFHFPRFTFYALKRKKSPKISNEEKYNVIKSIEKLANKKRISLREAALELGTTRMAYERYKSDLRISGRFSKELLMTKKEFQELCEFLVSINISVGKYFENKNINLGGMKKKFGFSKKGGKLDFLYKRDKDWALKAQELLKSNSMSAVEVILNVKRAIVYRELKRHGLEY